MAQKINPISFRLGTSQVWQIILQNYGVLSKNYFLILHKQLQIQKFLIQIFESNFLSIAKKELWYTNNKLFLNIYYSHILASLKFDYFALLQNIVETTTYWSKNKIYIRFYIKSHWFSTTNLLFDYFKYLVRQNNSLQKTLWNVCQFLEQHLNSTKVVYLKTGPSKVLLKGFKVRLAGRFNDSRNQIAKSMVQNTGSLPLVCLSNHVEFFSGELFTKLGTCRFQIWLFYKI